MAILIDKDTQVLIQGITGQEGRKACEWMSSYGTKVVAGVTPGKGGQLVGSVPVFSSVKEAKEAFPFISVSSIYAPPQFAKNAVVEALDAGIQTIHCIAEEVPLRDSAQILAKAKLLHARIIGPSSIGFIAPGIGKVGSIGGSDNVQFSTGPVGLISKSGGLCSEFSMMLTNHGLGQSAVIGIGGNVLIGTTYADLLPLFEHDPQTKVIVLIGEIGGTYEEEAAQCIKDLGFSKPVVAFISGLFAQTLPSGISFGHAGAIVDSKVGTREGKIKALKEVGAHIAQSPEDVITLIEKML